MHAHSTNTGSTKITQAVRDFCPALFLDTTSLDAVVPTVHHPQTTAATLPSYSNDLNIESF